MASVLTITLNPTIDVFGEAAEVRPTHKVRLKDTSFEPGGGGINVARIISTLGGEVEALALSGWEMGDFLGRLLKDEGIAYHPIPMEGETRVALMVHDQSTGLEYRFLPEGPEVHAREIDACAEAVLHKKEGFVVASGSLPRGAPVDSYVRFARAAAVNRLPFVLDSSGDALKAALAHGGIFLVKPSQSELESYAGHQLDAGGIETTARAIIARGQARMVAVTLGADGAVLATPDRLLRLPAIQVDVRSTVGAGDSFLGAMVWALSEGWQIEQAFLLGMAAGAAATGNPGTSLCRKEDVFGLFEKAGGKAPPSRA